MLTPTLSVTLTIFLPELGPTVTYELAADGSICLSQTTTQEKAAACGWGGDHIGSLLSAGSTMAPSRPP